MAGIEFNSGSGDSGGLTDFPSTGANSRLDTVNSNLVAIDGRVDEVEGLLGTAGTSPPSSGTGVIGWLRGIYDRLGTTLATTVIGGGGNTALVDSSGNLQVELRTDANAIAVTANNADGMSQSSATNKIITINEQLIFNGSTFDRVRDIVAGHGSSGIGLLGVGVVAFDLVANTYKRLRMDSTDHLWVGESNSYSHISTSTTTTVKSGAGVLHAISVNALGTVASQATIYDNTAGSGTVIAVVDTLTQLRTVLLDVAFTTGLTIVTTGTVAPDLTVAYR